jgi:predicted O-methyltransferase YrrM
MQRLALILLMPVVLACSNEAISSQPPSAETELDRKVWKLLQQQRWDDMNVPETDGRLLYNLIIENGYTRALEIGTSTGRSAIWMAWALSKTGGKLITIEIDEGRYREALANFEAAGLSQYIDARLADAHELVPALAGPLDFVFCDADKDWYKRYLDAVLPKLEPGGCFTAHNVTGWGHRPKQFVEYLESKPELETTIDRSSSAGVSISYKLKSTSGE